MKKLGFAIITLLILSAPFLFYGAGNYYGVCWPERRILSNDELIAGLISDDHLKFEFVNNNRLIRDAGILESEFSHRLIYASVKDFLGDNQDCCRVEAPGRRDYARSSDKAWSFQAPSFWLRIRGFAHANIGTAYNTPIATKDGKKIDIRRYGSYWVNSCGDSVEPPEVFGAI